MSSIAAAFNVCGHISCWPNTKWQFFVLHSHHWTQPAFFIINSPPPPSPLMKRKIFSELLWKRLNQHSAAGGGPKFGQKTKKLCFHQSQPVDSTATLQNLSWMMDYARIIWMKCTFCMTNHQAAIVETLLKGTLEGEYFDSLGKVCRRTRTVVFYRKSKQAFSSPFFIFILGSVRQ